MTKNEKKIIVQTVCLYNWSDYNGETPLAKKFKECRDKYPFEYNIKIVSKNQMQLLNDFFPLLVQAWNFEKDYVKEYLDFFQVRPRYEFYKIMDNYCSIK